MRVGNPFRQASSGRASRSRTATEVAPYPTPASPEVDLKQPKSRLVRWRPNRPPRPSLDVPETRQIHLFASLSRTERTIAASIVAVVAVTGIGVGYAISSVSSIGAAPQPATEIVAPEQEPRHAGAAPTSDDPLTDAPAAEVDPVPAAVADPAPGPFADRTPAPELAPAVEPVPAPQPDPIAEPAPQQVAPPVAAYYANCTEARAAGAAPIFAGEPGYGTHLDRDRDGIACDVTG